MLRIPWIAKRTNESILNQLKVMERLVAKINKMYLKYFGHIAKKTDAMEKIIISGKVNG